MFISCSKVIYSPYLYLHWNLGNRQWISLWILPWFRVRMACLFVLISLVNSVYSSLFSWGRESLVLSRYHNSSLSILWDYLEFLPVYSMTEIFVSQFNFGRVYCRYLVPRLFYSQFTIHRVIVKLRDIIELYSILYIV